MKVSGKTQIDIYELYKPLRNFLRTLHLQSTLELVYEVQRNQKNAAAIRLPIHWAKDEVVYRWELHTIAREALLNASLDDKKKRTGSADLIKIINCIRNISAGTFQRKVNSVEEAGHMLHLVVHQQRQWQNTNDLARFFRIYKIYSNEDVHKNLHEAWGVRLSTIFTLTLAIVGRVHRGGPRILANINYTSLGISDDERDAYFRMVGKPYADLRNSIEAEALYDESWAFTWNALEASPLIQLRPQFPEQYLCPLPELLIRRATDSLFFDVAKSGKEFGNSYGAAFEKYVGDVLAAQFNRIGQQVSAEQKYQVGKIAKHGVDWVVSDESGHLMFECKTRRISAKAKATADGELLSRSIDYLVSAVVQHYKNIDDALQGKTNWKLDGLPVYAVILTLDNWRLYAAHVEEMLDGKVKEGLRKVGLDHLRDSSPYVITSIADFELSGQAISQIGISKFFSSLAKASKRHFDLEEQAKHLFPHIDVQYKEIFDDIHGEMFGHLPEFSHSHKNHT